MENSLNPSVSTHSFPTGRKLRLLGLSATDLPTGASPPSSPSGSSHRSVTPANTAKTASTPDHFIKAILNEAVPFIDSAAPKNKFPHPGKLWKSRGSKKYAQSDAQVEVASLLITKDEIAANLGTPYCPQDMEDEHWFCRRSLHKDSTMKGTANWEEFCDGFRDNHAQAEEGWAPDVVGARKAASWNIDSQTTFDTRSEGEGNGGEMKGAEMEKERWKNVKMYLVEMKHKLPFPLSERVFPELLVIAEKENEKEFIIVSVPINDMSHSPFTQYTREKGVVLGRYSSVERIRKVPEDGRIEWIMATASSAEGNIPQWATNAGLYKLVADDVKYFMEYIEKQRKEGKDCAGNKKKSESHLASLELKNCESGRKLSLEAAASTAAIAGTTMAPSAVKAGRPTEVIRTASGRMTPVVPPPQA